MKAGAHPRFERLAERLLIRLLRSRALARLLRWRARLVPRRSVLFAGQAYYNGWYLSRELRKRGWCADVLNWDCNPDTQIYYHGQDFQFHLEKRRAPLGQIFFYLRALWKYDVFHFSNAHGITFGNQLRDWFRPLFGDAWEIHNLKRAGKRIVYSNNGCLDGVSQTSFSRWGEEPVCSICKWKNVPEVCSDERNLTWGKFRNSVADFQCTLGGNRVDCNDDPRVHEVPEFYCLDPDFWRPDLPIPDRYRLNFAPGTIALYHAVGHFDSRTDEHGINIKSTHIYRPLVQRLKDEGMRVEIMFFTSVPNEELRFYQAQADIFLDMLTFGWFGATAREAMMLGKPVICFLRPEWLRTMRAEIPEYVDELPIVNATPATVYEVLRALVSDAGRRREIGERSRAFALKWHSAQAGGRRLEQIYSSLLRSPRHA